MILLFDDFVILSDPLWSLVIFYPLQSLVILCDFWWLWSFVILSDPLWSFVIHSDLWSFVILSDPLWSFVILGDFDLLQSLVILCDPWVLWSFVILSDLWSFVILGDCGALWSLVILCDPLWLVILWFFIFSNLWLLVNFFLDCV